MGFLELTVESVSAYEWYKVGDHCTYVYTPGKPARETFENIVNQLQRETLTTGPQSYLSSAMPVIPSTMSWRSRKGLPRRRVEPTRCQT